MAFVQYRSYLLVRDGDKLELFGEGGLEIYDHYRQGNKTQCTPDYFHNSLSHLAQLEEMHSC